LIPKEGVRAVVTGAAGGLGRAFALRIAKHRGSVLVADIDEAGGKETVSLVEQAGGVAHFTRCDVRKPDEVIALVDAGHEALGGVDLVINNAGVAVAGLVGDVPLDDWTWQIDINLWGVIYGCHAFTPYFKKRGRGHVINVASMAGLIHMPSMGPYNVTKAAVVALSETMRGELLATDVGVTVLCPSFFETNILRSSRKTCDVDSSGAEKLMKRSRVQADDVAKIALRAAEKNELYALPHIEGRAMWGVKRLAPRTFYGQLGKLGARLSRPR
jgi:NAD(P)-dependent dehydrogenase (short-subunit alcohol dehydrogenase family)